MSFTPAISENVHHEAELAAVISRVARHVKAEDASAISSATLRPTM